jgi:hypothetical protein
VNAVMHTIRRLLEDDGLRAQISANARRIARERHDALKVRRRFQDVIRGAVNGEFEASVR